MKYLLNIVYCIGIVLYSPLLIYRIIFENRYRIGWANRFGKVQRKHPEKGCIWIHCVSVGEVNAAKTLVSQLSCRLADYEIVISTTTDTGYTRAKSIYGQNHCVFFYPFDFSFAVEKAFNNIKPSLCMLMELEVWPNFVKTAKRKAVPVMVINGRLSDKSFPTYKKVKPLIKAVFKNIDMVLAQTNEYAQRFIALGCDKEKVKVVSSLKYDTAQVTDIIEGADVIARSLGLNNKTLITAGGTGPGEEKIILDVFRQLLSDRVSDNLALAIVPRKPERFDEVAAVISQSGLKFIRFSQYKDSTHVCDVEYSVILVDTMGDLRKFYSLSNVTFVGRSLVPMGGSDMIEAAALGKATIFGPHTFNFKQTAEALLKGHGAIRVQDQRGLHDSIKRCLLDREYAAEFGVNGRQVVMNNQGATVKTVESAVSLLNRN